MSWKRDLLWMIACVAGIGAAAAQTLENDSYTIAQGAPLAADGQGGNPAGTLGNDTGLPANLPADVSVAARPKHGALTLSPDGTFFYRPHPNFVGTDTFTYAVKVSESIRFIDEDTEWKALNSLAGRPPALDSAGFDENWNKPGFDDSAWTAARGLIGYGSIGSTVVMEPDTDLGLPPNEQARFTVYLRTTFAVPESGRYSLDTQIRRDDGVIIYLDGEELLRSFQPAARVPSSAPDAYLLMVERGSGAAAFDEEYEPRLFAFDDLPLAAGEHTLAVSLHNVLWGSSDLGFKMDFLNLTRTDHAEVSITVNPGTVPPAGEPDWFPLIYNTGDLDTAGTGPNLYSNDSLFDEHGAAYREIIGLTIDDSQTEGEVLSFSPATGDFVFRPAAGFGGVTHFTYRIETGAGVSEPIKAYVFVDSFRLFSGVRSAIATVRGDGAFDLRIPAGLAPRIAEPTSLGSVYFRDQLPDNYQQTSYTLNQEGSYGVGIDRFVVEFSPEEGTNVRLPMSILVMSPMAQWRERQFDPSQLADLSISGAISDPDRDLVVNLIEYIFGTDPLDPLDAPHNAVDVQLTTEQAGLVIPSGPQGPLTSVPSDTMVELQMSTASSPPGTWVTLGVLYGNLNENWLTPKGLSTDLNLPASLTGDAAIFRFKYSLMPWVTDVPEGTR